MPRQESVPEDCVSCLPSLRYYMSIYVHIIHAFEVHCLIILSYSIVRCISLLVWTRSSHYVRYHVASHILVCEVRVKPFLSRFLCIGNFATICCRRLLLPIPENLYVRLFISKCLRICVIGVVENQSTSIIWISEPRLHSPTVKYFMHKLIFPFIYSNDNKHSTFFMAMEYFNFVVNRLTHAIGSSVFVNHSQALISCM